MDVPQPFDAAADQVLREPLALPQRRVRLRHQQRLPAQSGRGLAVSDAAQADQRPLARSRSPLDARLAPPDPHRGAGLEGGLRPAHVERAVVAVRAADPPGAHPSSMLAQSTTSTSTRLPSLAEHALITVRRALIVRPWRDRKS